MDASTSALTIAQGASTGEVLTDLRRSGKPRPWRLNKSQSLLLARAFLDLGEEKLSGRVYVCGSYLWFLSCLLGHEKKLKRAKFCGHRLCPMCAWRRSLLTAHQVRTVVNAALLRRPGLRFILLSLTIPNVRAEKLSEGLSALLQGWKRLTEREEVKSAWAGFFRAVEVTFNEQRDDFHPHIHALLAVPPGYFAGKNYISRDRWLELWIESVRIPGITQVDVRAVKPKGEGQDAIAGAVAEVAKYSLKPGKDGKAVFIRPTREESAKMTRVLQESLRNRRLVMFGGLFRELHRELNLSDADAPSADELVTIIGEPPSCFCSICKAEMVEQKYTWRGGPTGDYIG